MITKGFLKLTDGIEDMSKFIYNNLGWQLGTITLPWASTTISNHWIYDDESSKRPDAKSAEVCYYKYLTKLPDTTFSSKTENSKVTLQDLV